MTPREPGTGGEREKRGREGKMGGDEGREREGRKREREREREELSIAESWPLCAL